MDSRRGLFITFEGPEGGGKTVQAVRLQERLQAKGYKAVRTREPGGTAIGDKIRAILADPQNGAMLPLTELLLFEASRFQHVHEFILPQLKAGVHVICDRFCDSSLAYQSARGLPVDLVDRLNRLAMGECQPDLTFLLDISYEDGKQRLRQRYQGDSGQLDRIELEKREFFESLRQNYLDMAAGHLGELVLDSSRWHKIEAVQSVETVSGLIWEQVQKKLEDIR